MKIKIKKGKQTKTYIVGKEDKEIESEECLGVIKIDLHKDKDGNIKLQNIDMESLNLEEMKDKIKALNGKLRERMSDINPNDILKKSFEELKVYENCREDIKKKLVTIFEDEKIKPFTAYQILIDLIKDFEEQDPTFVLSKKLGKKFAEELGDEKVDRLNEAVREKLTEMKGEDKKKNDKRNKTGK